MRENKSEEPTDAIEKLRALETRSKIIDAVTTLYGPNASRVADEKKNNAREYLQTINVSTEEYDHIPRMNHPHIMAIIEDLYKQWERENNDK
jgi:hypothetical protein